MLAGAVGTVRLLLRAPLGSGRGRVVLPQTRCGPPSPRPGLLLCLSAARTMSHLQAPPQPLIRQVTGRPTPSTIQPPPATSSKISSKTPKTLWNPAVFYLRQIPGQLPGRGQFSILRTCRRSQLSTSRSIQTYNVAKHSKFHF